MALAGDVSAADYVFVTSVGPYPTPRYARRLIKKKATWHSHRDPNRKPRRDQRHPTQGVEVPIARSSAVISPIEPSETLVPGTVSWWNKGGYISSSWQYLSSSDDPFASYPFTIDSRLKQAWHFHRTVYEPVVMTALPATDADNAEFLDMDTRINLTNQAKFLAEMLNTCTVLSLAGCFSAEDLLHLRLKTMQCIREGLDGAPGTIPALLPAVLLLAVYEFVYGDQVVAKRVHLQAFDALQELGGNGGMVFPTSGLLLMQVVDHVLRGEVKDPWMFSFIRAYIPNDAARRRIGYL